MKHTPIAAQPRLTSASTYLDRVRVQLEQKVDAFVERSHRLVTSVQIDGGLTHPALDDVVPEACDEEKRAVLLKLRPVAVAHAREGREVPVHDGEDHVLVGPQAPLHRRVGEGALAGHVPHEQRDDHGHLRRRELEAEPRLVGLRRLPDRLRELVVGLGVLQLHGQDLPVVVEVARVLRVRADGVRKRRLGQQRRGRGVQLVVHQVPHDAVETDRLRHPLVVEARPPVRVHQEVPRLVEPPAQLENPRVVKVDLGGEVVGRPALELEHVLRQRRRQLHRLRQPRRVHQVDERQRQQKDLGLRQLRVLGEELLHAQHRRHRVVQSDSRPGFLLRLRRLRLGQQLQRERRDRAALRALGVGGDRLSEERHRRRRVAPQQPAQRLDVPHQPRREAPVRLGHRRLQHRRAMREQVPERIARQARRRAAGGRVLRLGFNCEMQLPAALWRYWQAIWPAGYRATAYVNLSAGIRPGRSDAEDVFAGTRWTSVSLETRGNGLFLLDPEECVAAGPGAPTLAWVLEHVHLDLRPSSSHLTLPSAAAASGADRGAVLYFLETQGDDTAFLAVHFSHMEAARDAYVQLRRCSLTYVRSLVDGSGDLGLSAGDTAHTIESLRYSREALAQQKEMICMDNTLLLSQYATNKQVFSECTAMQMRENAALRSQLEQCLDRIAVLEDDAHAHEGIIHGLKEEREQLIGLASKMAVVRRAGSGPRDPSTAALEQDYEATVMEVERLNQELDALRRDNARITNQYHRYRREVDREYDRVEELLYHSTIYEMLMYWIMCNDLKVRAAHFASKSPFQVEYYETCHRMSPQEHQAFCERVQMAQEEFRTCITLARASYINCRTHLFNELLGSISGHKLVLPRSKRLLSLALERLDWIFQPESSRFDAREPVWMNQQNFDGLLETLLYKTADHAWYNKLTYVSALKPILTNDAASESLMLTLKRQLYESLKQIDSLKQQVATLQRVAGNKDHWSSLQAARSHPGLEYREHPGKLLRPLEQNHVRDPRDVADLLLLQLQPRVENAKVQLLLEALLAQLDALRVKVVLQRALRAVELRGPAVALQPRQKPARGTHPAERALARVVELGVLGVRRERLLQRRLVEGLGQALRAVGVQVADAGVELVAVLHHGAALAEVDAVERQREVAEVRLRAQDVAHDLRRGAPEGRGEVVKVLQPDLLEEALEQRDVGGLQHRLLGAAREAGEEPLERELAVRLLAEVPARKCVGAAPGLREVARQLLVALLRDHRNGNRALLVEERRPVVRRLEDRAQVLEVLGRLHLFVVHGSQKGAPVPPDDPLEVAVVGVKKRELHVHLAGRVAEEVDEPVPPPPAAAQFLFYDFRRHDLRQVAPRRRLADDRRRDLDLREGVDGSGQRVDLPVRQVPEGLVELQVVQTRVQVPLDRVPDVALPRARDEVGLEVEQDVEEQHRAHAEQVVAHQERGKEHQHQLRDPRVAPREHVEKLLVAHGEQVEVEVAHHDLVPGLSQHAENARLVLRLHVVVAVDALVVGRLPRVLPRGVHLVHDLRLPLPQPARVDVLDDRVQVALPALRALRLALLGERRLGRLGRRLVLRGHLRLEPDEPRDRDARLGRLLPFLVGEHRVDLELVVLRVVLQRRHLPGPRVEEQHVGAGALARLGEGEGRAPVSLCGAVDARLLAPHEAAPPDLAYVERVPPAVQRQRAPGPARSRNQCRRGGAPLPAQLSALLSPAEAAGQRDHQRDDDPDNLEHDLENVQHDARKQGEGELDEVLHPAAASGHRRLLLLFDVRLPVVHVVTSGNFLITHLRQRNRSYFGLAGCQFVRLNIVAGVGRDPGDLFHLLVFVPSHAARRARPPLNQP
ncbi:calcium-binding and coiled-coil domain-containing protein 2, putative [Babesia caballi]|uniref:Calcium-binding and coiled-coil domain-containing protein 2, putative n=1 Tax=Babesia caballi TaxID=5871 RepID=A0AAV4M312_BABCB|nr:calcium-binding and coiled-coil domain-containing protein 2, putative [Babesia caballi]